MKRQWEGLVNTLIAAEPTSMCVILADLRRIVQILPHLDSSDTALEEDQHAKSNFFKIKGLE